jgi:hypothetical protein
MKGFIELGICEEPFILIGENKINVEKLLNIWDEKFVISCNQITNEAPYKLARLYYNGKRWCSTNVSKEDYYLIIKSINIQESYFKGKIDKAKSLERYFKLLNPPKTEKQNILETIEYYQKNNIPYKISKELMEKFHLEP